MAFERKRITRQTAQQGRQVGGLPETRRAFFSYHASQKNQNFQPAQPRQHTKVAAPSSGSARPQKILSFIIIFVFVVCTVYTLTLSTSPKIVIVSPTGQRALRLVSDYQVTSANILRKSLLNRSKLTVDSSKIERQVGSAFSDLSDVDLVLPLMGRRPVLKVTPEQPALLLSSSGGVYVIGKSGKVLAKTTDIEGADTLPVPTVHDKSQLEIVPGKGALSTQDVEFITTIIQQFSDKKIQITDMTLPALAAELHVRIHGEPYYIKFSLLTDARISFGQFYAVKTKLDAEQTKPAEYIDARVDERVYVK